MENPQMRELRYAQMSDLELQCDPSPAAAAEIKRRNAMRTVPTGFAAIVNSVFGRWV